MDSVSYLPASGSAGYSCSSGCVCQDKKHLPDIPNCHAISECLGWQRRLLYQAGTDMAQHLENSRSEAENLPPLPRAAPRQAGPRNVFGVSPRAKLLHAGSKAAQLPGYSRCRCGLGSWGRRDSDISSASGVRLFPPAFKGWKPVLKPLLLPPGGMLF